MKVGNFFFAETFWSFQKSVFKPG